MNLLTSVTNSSGAATTLSYDPNGNLLSLTDPWNALNPTTYAYDDINRLQVRRVALLEKHVNSDPCCVAVMSGPSRDSY